MRRALPGGVKGMRTEQDGKCYNHHMTLRCSNNCLPGGSHGRLPEEVLFDLVLKGEIGRASCRERV